MTAVAVVAVVDAVVVAVVDKTLLGTSRGRFFPFEAVEKG